MRFLNVVLTIIAVELGWMAIIGTSVPVAAQQEATRVVITGVELPRNETTLPVTLRGVALDRDAFVPVAVLGQVEDRLPRTRFQPIDVRSSSPLKIEIDRPLRIQEPVTVRIPVTSSPVPGQ